MYTVTLKQGKQTLVFFFDREYSADSFMSAYVKGLSDNPNGRYTNIYSNDSHKVRIIDNKDDIVLAVLTLSGVAL